MSCEDKRTTFKKAKSFSKTASSAFHRSYFYNFFRSYDATEDKFTNSYLNKLLAHKKMSESVITFKNIFAKTSETSILVNTFKRFFEKTVSCSLHCYAVVMLCFSLYSLAICALQYTIGVTNSIVTDNGYFSFILLVLSLVFMPVRSSLTVFLKNSKLLSYIHKCLFTSYNMTESTEEHSYTPGNATLILIGTVLGISTYIIPVKVILISCLGVFMTLSFFKTPENSLPILIILSPFLSVAGLSLLTFMSFAAFLFKVCRGKRSFAFKYFDVLVLFFLLIIFTSGFSSSSVRSYEADAVAMLILMCAYFLFRNCVRTADICKKCIYSLGFSAIFASFSLIYDKLFTYGYIGIAERTINLSFGILPQKIFESDIQSGEFLLVMLAFVLTASVISDTTFKKALFAFSVLLSATALVLTESKGLLLAFAVCILIYISASFRNPTASISAIVAVYIAISLFITNSAFLGNDRFFNINSYKESILSVTSNIVSDNLLAGIGAGKQNFSDIFSAYSHFSSSAVDSCYNTYLQIFTQLGIFGFIFFIYVSIQFYKMQFSCISNFKKGNMLFPMTAIAAISSVSTIYLRGLTSFIWSDYRAFFIFFTLIGISVAAHSLSCKSENNYTEE